MATLLEDSNGYHPGELAVHRLLKVPTSARRNPTAPGLPPHYVHRVIVSPLLAVGTLDEQGRPWTSIWGGERGFARPVARDILGMQSLVDKKNDPVVEAFLGRAADGEVLQPEGGIVMSALSIDLENRDRVKLAGRMAVGTVAEQPANTALGEIQLAMHVQESLGNCPKYLNKKTIRAHFPSPRLVSSSLPLPPEALALIEKADLFFLSSTNGQTMDTNHRGGPAGFVRVLNNSFPEDGTGDGVVLVFPEYSGNRLYQTLGNLHTNPRLGVVIPDFETSDVLYLTGETELLIGPSAATIMPHANLAVKLTVHAARFVKDGLPFRGTPGEPSPYNPPVRRLASESPASLSQPLPPPSAPLATAVLVGREPITPTIARFTFRLQPPGSKNNNSSSSSAPLGTWLPGQHITLSFAHELALGWSHMRDADPQSLNDDFIRTFTISSPPPPPPPPLDTATTSLSPSTDRNNLQIELTLRRHGPATNLLFTHPVPSHHPTSSTAPSLEVPVLAVGGEEAFRIELGGDDGGGDYEGESPAAAAATAASDEEGDIKKNKEESKKKKKAVFVAGGIGITPLLAQAPGLLAERHRRPMEVLWSLRWEDVALAVDAFERVGGLAGVTRVFVTGLDVPDAVGGGGGDENGKGSVERLRELGARVEVRRMTREDVLAARDPESGTKYFACASPRMLRSVMGWLADEDVVSESFEY
ncbi:fa29c04e-5179-4387-8aa8-340c7f20a08f [Thermothielavioides terrestris]|uniref:Fa29c04e-5179-4387-8aa8-340c7f20a08f n=1 Tax=Thermothielavioides terrestris TaxID=2587410 RepID=A0A3S4BLF9_9PEZI|nr:fa29c04e-5179-4387-8aa8-340c7f20a08f [Thermothielavioides terrestris]